MSEIEALNLELQKLKDRGAVGLSITVKNRNRPIEEYAREVVLHLKKMNKENTKKM